MALAPAIPARAQLFNQFIPEQISGRDVEPDVTVASRLRSDYDSGGIRVGNVTVRPQVAESVGYESNVLGQSNARGVTLLRTNASVDARADTSRGGLNASALLDDNRYLGLSSESYANWNVRLGGSYEFGRDTGNISVSHDNQNQTPRDLGVPQLAAPLAVAVDQLNLAYRSVLNRLSLTPTLLVARFAYNSGFVGNTIYDQGFRNRVSITPGIVAAYEFATRRSAVVIVRNTTGFYSQSSVQNPRRNFNDVELLAGIDYDLDGKLRARVLAGYEQRTFISSAYPTIQAPIAELSLTYNPTGLTTVSGILTRRIQDSTSEATATATSLSATLRVDHELRRNIILGATAGVTQYDYGSLSTNQVLYEGTVSGSYLFNRHVAASASYDILARTSSNVTALNLNGFTTGSNYTDHRVLLQLRLGL